MSGIEIPHIGLWFGFDPTVLADFLATGKFGLVVGPYLNREMEREITKRRAMMGELWTLSFSPETEPAHHKALGRDCVLYLGSIGTRPERMEFFWPMWLPYAAGWSRPRSLPEEIRPMELAAMISNSTCFRGYGKNNLRRRLDTIRGIGKLGFRLRLAGKAFRNDPGIPCGQDGTIEWLSASMFHFSAENSVSPGYITEKLWFGYKAGCVPVYQGCRDAGIINPEAIIDGNAKPGEIVAAMSGMTAGEWNGKRNLPLFLPDMATYAERTFPGIMKLLS